MGESTAISWCRSTVNCWHGCTKVDELCRFCYAEVSTPVRVKRAGGLEVWGANAARSETKSWASDLRKWNRAAVASGEFWPVFGQSLSDTFEDRPDECVISATGRGAVTLDGLRKDFFAAIEAAPALTFQLLTKRPENVTRMVPPSWLDAWPRHVWIGTSVGDQESAEKRIPHLLKVPAAIRFLSVEPQLGPVDLTDLVQHDDGPGEHHYSALECDVGAEDDGEWNGATIAWVICGGESGPKARPFDLAWARSLRDQCTAANVAYFCKQLGAHPVDAPERRAPLAPRLSLADSHGANEAEWPRDLQGCRAFPRVLP
jgi:protein gp37